MPELDVPGLDQLARLPHGTTACYRDVGRPTDPAVLLVAGLGEDLTSWTGPFVEALVAHGLRVIAMDNRDAGRSTHVHATPPALWRQLLAVPRSDAYSLEDMAADCRGLLDHLGLDRVHVVGRSMGGMIAQVLAAASPERVASLTSLYSTTGARRAGQPAWSTLALLAGPAPTDRTDAVRGHLRLTRHVAGTAYPIDAVAEAEVAARTWDRCAGDQAAGAARQVQAIQRSGDRTEALRRVVAPTLVIHGDRDLLVAPSGGAATVAAVPRARHVVVPGMGHHVPAALVGPITQHIAQHAARVTGGGHHAEIA